MGAGLYPEKVPERPTRNVPQSHDFYLLECTTVHVSPIHAPLDYNTENIK